jgi:hypothetical protein
MELMKVKFVPAGPRFLPLRTDGTTGWLADCFPAQLSGRRVDNREWVIGFQYSRRSNGLSVRGLLSRILPAFENKNRLIRLSDLTSPAACENKSARQKLHFWETLNGQVLYRIG